MQQIAGRAVLILALVVAIVSLAMPVAGAGPGGTGIEDATPLVGTMGGNLAANSNYWYKIADDGKGLPMGILMNYWPTYIEQNRNITFRVWAYDSKLMGYPYAVIGEGSIGGQPVGVKYWRGSPSNAGKNYYIQIINDTAGQIVYAVAFIGDKEEARFPKLLSPAAPGGVPVPLLTAPTNPPPAATPVAPPIPTAGPTGVTPPVSKLYPENTYSLGEEKKIGAYTVRLWKAKNPDNRPAMGIVTISASGMTTISIEDVYKLGELTGQTITGIGVPVVIIETFSGGAHCCFNTVVYELGTSPVKVLDTKPSNCGGRFQDLTGTGVYEFITCDDSYAYAYCSYAASPKPRVILQYKAGLGYVVASSSFPDQYAEDIERDTQTATSEPTQGLIGSDGTPKCAVLPLVLDYLYSGRPDDAWAALYRYYQFPDVEAFASEIGATAAGSPLCVLPQ